MAKKIELFTTALCGELAKKVEAALAPLEAEYGVQIKTGRGSYTASTLSLKVEFATKGEGGTVNTREAEAFKVNAYLYGLKPTDLGRMFVNCGRTFVVAGLKNRARTKPILAREVATNNMYVFSEETVKRELLAAEG